MSHLTLTKGSLNAHISVLKNAYFGNVSTTLPASTEPFKFIQQKRYLMFIGEVYWKWIYLLNYKCFIIAVCMVLCGNICFSGFYSDDLYVQGADWGGRKKKVVKRSHWVTDFENSGVFAAHSASWPDLENKSFAKNKKKYEFTILLLVIFQSCSCSLM